MRPTVAVVGSGSWGTTLAHLAAGNGHPVTLWCRSPEQAADVNERHRNARYLPDLALSPDVRATTDLVAAVRGVPVVLLAVPSQSFREVCRAARAAFTPDQYVIHATKGLELGTHRRMSEILAEETCIRQYGVLSGPNIAPEIAAGKPAGTVIASRFPYVIEAGRRLLFSERFRVYGNDDVLGVELAGSLKNIVAIAAGAVAELGLGDNARALLMTRGISEVARLGAALGAAPATFSGLAGIGDLIVTCESPLSRNFRVGVGLARGLTVAEVVAQLGMVAEGIPTARTAHELIAERGLRLHQLETTYRVLHEGLSVADALRELMARPSGRDVAWS